MTEYFCVRANKPTVERKKTHPVDAFCLYVTHLHTPLPPCRSGPHRRYTLTAFATVHRPLILYLRGTDDASILCSFFSLRYLLGVFIPESASLFSLSQLRLSFVMRSTKRTALRSDEVAALPPVMDVAHEHYPFCVVWTPIPLLSWLLPFVGHIGICDSQGRIYDFQGDYGIGDDRMLFGNPTRYWDVSKLFVPSFYSAAVDEDEAAKPEARAEAVRQEIEAYDRAIFNVVQHFRRNERYSFCCNNCHAFVAACLNAQPTLARQKEDTFTVCFRMALHGRYVNTGRMVKSLLPFTIIAFLLGLLLGILL